MFSLKQGWRASLRLLVLALLPWLVACQPAVETYQQESYVFGTRVQITTTGLSAAKAQAIIAPQLAKLDSLHQRWHAWQPGSELVAINQAIAAGKPTVITPDLLALLQAAQRYESLSDGLFSPAIGRLVALWGFHADSFAPLTPDPSALAAVIAAKPRMADISLQAGSLSARNPAVVLDLGGIAKGWALDYLRQQLQQAGVKSALINIGGNIIALGTKPDGSPWQVGLQHPRTNEAMAILPLYDGEAIGTSGDYQRYFDYQGQRYCHLIDPRDGSARCRLQSASVIFGPSPQAGILSDVASKPIYFAGPAQAMRYARRFGTQQVLIIDQDGSAWISTALQARLKWRVKPAQVRRLA